MTTGLTSEELQNIILGLDPEFSLREAGPGLTIKVPVSALLKLMKFLRDDPGLQFDFLQVHTAVDWPTEDRFECLYMLVSTKLHHEVTISVSVPRSSPVTKSVCSVWPIAEWQEREVFDMFGVVYENHPDLRRIFLDDDWVGFPLRKDYQDEFMLRRPW